MPARPPNFQLIAIIASGTFNTLGALWIFADARARQARKPLFAALAMLLLGPLWLAFYMSDRPLRAQERRSGGFGYTWTRYFTTAWTASLVPWLAVFLFLMLGDLLSAAWPPTTSGSADLIVIDLRPLLTLLTIWFVPVVAALAIGYNIRRADAMEIGGPAPAATRVPLTAVSVLAACLTYLLLTSVKRLL